MKTSTNQQIKNGLRIGGGIGSFWVAAMLLGIAVDGLRAGAPDRLRLWPDGAIAAGLIALATVILLLTARVWILYIAGCLLFAFWKFLIVIASGRNFYSPHEPFSRLEAADLALFSLISLFLIYRVVQSHTPTAIDRWAFTLFTFCLVFGLSRQNVALMAIWQLLGLAALCVAWFLARRKHSKHRAGAAHTSFGTASNK